MAAAAMRCWSVVALLLSLGQHDNVGQASEATGSSVEDEDRLESEIDPREPRSFASSRWETLSVRQDGFKNLKCHNNGVESNMYIANWEVWARDYWYETRVHNCTCPVVPKGIAAASDWAMVVPCIFGNVTKEPKLLFVTTMMLPHFAESTLRFLPADWRFILISAGHDRTIPLSSGDRRYPPLRGMWMGANWNRIVDSEQVVHWYAENKDVVHPKLSALPTAMCAEDADNRDDFPPADTILPLEKRPLKVSTALPLFPPCSCCSHTLLSPAPAPLSRQVMSLDRQRPGPQFYDRAAVEVMCRVRANHHLHTE